MIVWDQKSPAPGMCRRTVSDGNYRAPHFYPCRRKAAAGGLCGVHASLDARAEKRAADRKGEREKSEAAEREGRRLARRLGIKGASAHYNALGPYRNHGYTRYLVVSFKELERLARWGSRGA